MMGCYLVTDYGKFDDFPYISNGMFEPILLIDTERSHQMKLNLKWILGIVLTLLVLFSLPPVWRVLMPFGGYGMMRGYAYGMPMMRFGLGMMPFGMLLMWLIPLGILTLIVLAIVWLARQLTTKAQ